MYELLMGIDGTFSNVRTQILISKRTTTLGTNYHLVVEDEQQRVISATRKTVHDVDSFQTFTFSRQGPTKNKRSVKETKRVNNNQESEHCTFCGKNGHNKEGCFKKIGYPVLWPMKGKKEKEGEGQGEEEGERRGRKGKSELE